MTVKITVLKHCLELADLATAGDSHLSAVACLSSTGSCSRSGPFHTLEARWQHPMRGLGPFGFSVQHKRTVCTAVACGNMDVHAIPKLVGSIFTQHSVPCHVVAMGQVARDIFPSFDDLLYANQHHYNSLEWRDKAATISVTGTFTVRGHAVVSVVPFVIDLTNEDGIVV